MKEKYFVSSLVFIAIVVFVLLVPESRDSMLTIVFVWVIYLAFFDTDKSESEKVYKQVSRVVSTPDGYKITFQDGDEKTVSYDDKVIINDSMLTIEKG